MKGLYRDRSEAGRLLAARMTKHANRNDVIVLALPRGGVPVAYEVAHAIHAPLDVFIVRKLGVPGHEELAMGAVASGGVQVINEQVVQQLSLSQEQIDQAAARELREIERREQSYRGDRPHPELQGKVVILIDDGLATGATMLAAVRAVRLQDPSRIVVAVPVASAETCEMIRPEVEEIVCVATPEPFYAVGLWYEDFSQTTDEEVHDLLARAEHVEAR